MNRLRTGARVVLAIVFAHGAAMLLLHPRLPGYPEPLPAILLGAAEIVAAVLFAIPRTSFAGGIGLLLVLAWAAGFHGGVHLPARLLFVGIVLVAILTFAIPRRHAS